MKRFIRRLVGMHIIRAGQIDISQDVNYRANVTDKRLDEIEAKIEKLTTSVAFMCSLFGHIEPDEEPLTPADLGTKNPWDRT